MKNYSILNSYQYGNQKSIIPTLDALSSPIRKVLGGRNIRFVSNRAERSDKMSILGRVATAALLILFFPIGIISGSSLLLKRLVKPCLDEKNIVNRLYSHIGQQSKARTNI
jgi:hypothetical protein